MEQTRKENPNTANKEKAIDLAIGTIEKNFGKGSIMRLKGDEPIFKNVPTISSGSPKRPTGISACAYSRSLSAVG